MKNYRVVIFDLDDTLTVSRDAYFEAYRHFAALDPESYRPDCEEEIMDIRRVVYHYTFLQKEKKAELYQWLCEKWKIRNAPPTEWDFEVMLRTEQCKYIRLLPWSVEVLNDLKEKGIRLSMITNGWSYFQHMKLDKLGIVPLFDDILIAEETGVEKPDPAIFRMAVERIGANVEECLFVGNDAKRDIGGARSVGMDCLWITPSAENTAGATYLSPDVRILKTFF